MTRETKFKIQDIVYQAVNKSYEIGFKEGRAYQQEKARKPGKWKPCGILHKCSKCGMCFGTKTNFCPNCGDRKTESEDNANELKEN